MNIIINIEILDYSNLYIHVIVVLIDLHFAFHFQGVPGILGLNGEPGAPGEPVSTSCNDLTRTVIFFI